MRVFLASSAALHLKAAACLGAEAKNRGITDNSEIHLDVLRPNRRSGDPDSLAIAEPPLGPVMDESSATRKQSSAITQRQPATNWSEIPKPEKRPRGARVPRLLSRTAQPPLKLDWSWETGFHESGGGCPITRARRQTNPEVNWGLNCSSAKG